MKRRPKHATYANYQLEYKIFMEISSKKFWSNFVCEMLLSFLTITIFFGATIILLYVARFFIVGNILLLVYLLIFLVLIFYNYLRVTQERLIINEDNLKIKKSLFFKSYIQIPWNVISRVASSPSFCGDVSKITVFINTKEPLKTKVVKVAATIFYILDFLSDPGLDSEEFHQKSFYELGYFLNDEAVKIKESIEKHLIIKK